MIIAKRLTLSLSHPPPPGPSPLFNAPFKNSFRVYLQFINDDYVDFIQRNKYEKCVTLVIGRPNERGRGG